ncbi:MAG: methyltransferase domain-containing protein [Alicyclobacillaceae bacterium]|nr:methyltransferase domain-containing protein [Alicyclobacillaceae bacterium]
MQDIEKLRGLLVRLGSSPIVISPWLAYIKQGVEFEGDLFDFLYWNARDYATEHWREEYVAQVFGTLPVPARVPKTAIYETAISTALSLAYNHSGDPLIDKSSADQSLALLDEFVQEHGFDQFVSLYSVITAFENYLAIHYYGEMKESDFVFGKLHRPWIGYTLHDELILMQAMGTVEIFLRDGVRCLRLTELGRQRLEAIRALLNSTGYTETRSNLLRISHFSEMEDYESVIRYLGPELSKWRRRLLELAHIQEGMHVLDLGCGSGSLSFDAGLADQVGPSGRVVAVDPAQKLLQQAADKKVHYDKPWVSIQMASAEDLPFPDGTFDAVLAMLSIHLTDIPKALQEIARVLKPGGLFASFHALKFPFEEPFLRDWFEPIQHVSGLPPHDHALPDETVVPKYLPLELTSFDVRTVFTPCRYDDPDKVVRFFVENVGLFNDELMTLPWTEYQSLLRQLKENGASICSRLTKEELTVEYPAQLVMARRTTS